MSEYTGITARQLRDLLNGLPDDVLDFTAIAEGCDCEDGVGCIIVRQEDREVTIGRYDDPLHRNNYGRGREGTEYRPPTNPD